MTLRGETPCHDCGGENSTGPTGPTTSRSTGAPSQPAASGWPSSALPPRVSHTATSPTQPASHPSASLCSHLPARATLSHANSTAGSPNWNATASPSAPKTEPSTASGWSATPPGPSTPPRPEKHAAVQQIIPGLVTRRLHQSYTNLARRMHEKSPKPAEMAVQLWREMTEYRIQMHL